jgi:FkbM family methyltransferase
MTLDRLMAAIKNPKKILRLIQMIFYYAFRKRNGILIIVGLDPGGIFNYIHKGFKQCYGFEANPERFTNLVRKFGKNKHIKLYNVAVAQYDGEVTFNISSNNNGASSSIGNFKEDWKEQYQGRKIEMVKKITIPCINLNSFCKKNNIHFINEYISDIQGMDLEVLKTLKPMIEEKKIGAITCEVTKNEKGNIYSDLPDNSEMGFESLLRNNYKLVAKGNGILKDNKYDFIPEIYWEMDCKWKVKK